MADRIADDVVSIAARLKEIQKENDLAIRGKPEPEAQKKPTESTKTGDGGGFTTPAGDYYDPYCG